MAYSGASKELEDSLEERSMRFPGKRPPSLYISNRLTRVIICSVFFSLRVFWPSLANLCAPARVRTRKIEEGAAILAAARNGFDDIKWEENLMDVPVHVVDWMRHEDSIVQLSGTDVIGILGQIEIVAGFRRWSPHSC